MYNETEKLLSEYGYEPDEQEIEQRLLIRERAKALLDSHGEFPFSYFGIPQVEEELARATEVNEVLKTHKGLQLLARTIPAARNLIEFGTKISWAESQALVDGFKVRIEETPLRTIILPFKSHQIALFAWQPERASELTKVIQFPGMHTEVAPFTFEDCDVRVESTAWGYGLSAEPMDLSQETRIRRGSIPIPYDFANTRIDAVLTFMEEYFANLQPQLND